MLTRRRLRTFRTLFVHRWHAAQTVGEWFGNDEVGFRFEHINHTRSLVEYVWRYGPFLGSAGRYWPGSARGGAEPEEHRSARGAQGAQTLREGREIRRLVRNVWPSGRDLTGQPVGAGTKG